MRLISTTLFGGFLTLHHADAFKTREGHGVVGYGVTMFDPPCAYSCINAIQQYPLDCPISSHEEMVVGQERMKMPTAECKANNDAFLQTTAWCFHQHCGNVKNSTLESVWELDVVGNLKNQPSPRISYGEALSFTFANPPKIVASTETPLRYATLIDEKTVLANWNALFGLTSAEILMSKLSITLVVATVAIPIFLSCLRLLPWPATLTSFVYAHIINPPAFGKAHSTPVLGLGYIPTRGQALFIAFLWFINILFCCIDYTVYQPNAWGPDQLLCYIANRAGHLSFVNLSLTFLFALRNNPLLWFTNWSHSTFLLLHRWIAVICVIQAAVHSILYVDKYIDVISQQMARNDWQWGIVAMLCFLFILPLSVLKLRQKLYSFFLASHILLALLAVVGCVLHVTYRYEWQWGFEMWLLMAISFWAFERLLARPFRIWQTGSRRAFVTIVDDDYLQLVIPGVELRGHAYFYFPTITWRIWESNPFSVIPTIARQPTPLSSATSSDLEEMHGEYKLPAIIGERNISFGYSADGLMLFMRRRRGVTRRLAKHANSPNGVMVWIEGSYGSHTSIVSPEPIRTTLEYPSTLFIAGGVGITAMVPHILQTRDASPRRTAYKMIWASRSQALVDRVRMLFGGEETAEKIERWGDCDVVTAVGRRINLKQVIADEASAGPTTVVVCGPTEMMDEARMAVIDLCKKGNKIRLIEESYVW